MIRTRPLPLAIEFYVPRTCCVLHSKPGAHAYPTYPQYPDDATRLQKIAEWLNTLTDDDFREVTGRARVVQVALQARQVDK